MYGLAFGDPLEGASGLVLFLFLALKSWETALLVSPIDAESQDGSERCFPKVLPQSKKDHLLILTTSLKLKFTVGSKSFSPVPPNSSAFRFLC